MAFYVREQQLYSFHHFSLLSKRAYFMDSDRQQILQGDRIWEILEAGFGKILGWIMWQILLASLNKSNVTKPCQAGAKDKLPANIFYADVSRLNIYSNSDISSLSVILYLFYVEFAFG